MENELGYINDFVEITTKVKGNKELLETYANTGIVDFFETHLSYCLRDQYSSYKLKNWR